MIYIEIAGRFILLCILLVLLYIGVSVIVSGGKCYEPPVPAKNGAMKCKAENGVWIVFKPKGAR